MNNIKQKQQNAKVHQLHLHDQVHNKILDFHLKSIQNEITNNAEGNAINCQKHKIYVIMLIYAKK